MVVVVEELLSEASVKLVDVLSACTDPVSTGKEEIPVPVPVPSENTMPSGDWGIVEELETETESGGDWILETPTVVPVVSPGVSVAVVEVIVAVTVGVGTKGTEPFVGALLSVIVEPLSSSITVTGTTTTVVDGLSGAWRWRIGALSPNSRLTNRGK